MAILLRGGDCTAQRLRIFLQRLTALHSVTHTKTSGLVRFLELAAPLLREMPPAPTRPSSQPTLEPVRLEEIVRRLEGPIGSAGTGGAFLNVWSVAGLGRSELRNAAVLAWFLDPRGSHGLGPRMLHKFFDVVSLRGGWPAFDTDLSRATVRTEEWPLGSETDRVDIAIDDDEFVIFVEIKIDAGEGPNQLRRYLLAAQEKARVLRRARGHVVYISNRRPSTDHIGLAVLTWSDVARLLSARQREGFGGSLAHQFARHVQTFS